MFCERKVEENIKYLLIKHICTIKIKYPEKGYDEKKIKIVKENTDVNKLSNQRKCTKSDQRN